MGWSKTRVGRLLHYSNIKDMNGARVVVEQLNGADYCWIRCWHPTSRHDGPPQLTISQAKRVIVGLQKFVKEKE